MSRLAINFIFLFFFMGIFGVASVLLGQDINWDLLQYHFYNGYAFLHHRSSLDISPAMIQTFYNPFLDVVNYLIINLLNPRLSEFLLGSFSGVSCFFLYKIALLIFEKSSNSYIYAGYSLLIGMTGAGGISLLNTTTNDTKMAMLCIISLYCALKALNSPLYNGTSFLDCFVAKGTPRNDVAAYNIVLSGLCSGLCLGLKLPAICYTFGLFIALVFYKKNYYTLGLFCLSVLAGFIISDGYWMFQLFQKFQNPFFPLYNDYFHSEYAPYLSFNFYISQEPLYLYHLIFLPYFLALKNTLTTEVLMRDLRLCVLFSLLLLLIPYYLINNKTPKNINNKLAGFVLIFFIVSYFIWLTLFALYRYLIPLELLSGILITYFLQYFFTTHKIRIICLSFLTVIICFSTIYPVWAEKQSYGNHYFSFSNIPVLPNNATIFLTTVPLSYVIPFFQQDARFIGLPFLTIKLKEVNSTELAEKKYLSKVMKNFSSPHAYTLAFEKPDSFAEKSEQVLHYFGWEKAAQCKHFTDNMGHAFELCPLRPAE